MRVAVVGHVEWVEFLVVDGVPAPGAILRAPSSWAEPAGGGGVAAAELARLAGTCTLFTALGTDDVGRRVPDALAALGVDARVQWRHEAHRRAVTLVDPSAERTIVVIGPAQAPTGDLELAGYDAVYFCKGDAAALRAARQARVLVATARVLPVIREAGVRLDALVRSISDPSERYATGDLDVGPSLVCETDGRRGGQWLTIGERGRWEAAALPGLPRDAYGAGDSFAAGLTFALAGGASPSDAVAFAATRGAEAVCRTGAHGS